MKDHLDRLVESANTHGWDVAREYLQARILQALQREGAMQKIAFHGGTSLRFLFDLPRYSEDLDFALEATDGFDFMSCIGTVVRDLRSEGYEIDAKARVDSVVHSAMVKFPGLPHELGLSPRKEQVLAIKVEVDTDPPAGATCETTIVRRHVLLNLYHHDRASLLAGKLHAVLQRPYVKGRDIYDLVWYLSDRRWPEPNLVLLGNALSQTGWTGPTPTRENWRELVAERIHELDWTKVVSDVRPFLEDVAEVELLARDQVLALL